MCLMLLDGLQEHLKLAIVEAKEKHEKLQLLLSEFV